MYRHLHRVAVFVALLLGVGVVAAQPSPAVPTPDPCPIPADPALSPAAFYIGQGDAAFRVGRYPRAINAYTCALVFDPAVDGALVKRGYAYAALGDSTLAFADYDAAIAFNEANAAAYVHRGTLYARLGNFGLALTDFELAAALNPADPAPLVNAALVHALEGNYADALADLETVETFAADYPPLHTTFAAVYSALAATRYQRFALLTNNAALPGGAPGALLNDIDIAQRTGDFSVWLPLFVPTSPLAP